MDDDLILPETETNDYVEPTTTRKKSKTPLYVGLAALAFVCLASALVIVILNKNTNPTQQTERSSSDDTLKYDDQEFDKAMTAAEERLDVGDFSGAQYYMKDYSVPERMTLTQKYHYYTFLTTLYSGDNLNRSDIAAKYYALSEEVLKQIRKGEQ